MLLLIDGGEKLQPILDFRKRHKLTFPILDDADNKVDDAYLIEAIPTNVVIDKEGIVRYWAEGFDPNALKSALKQLNIELK
ncbi:Peroxiredoxin [Chthonomonas calidirosea]|uniref:Peroxiredoxin n=1 Tax=Chthonomonas calidirosea (strain DSM 23976 / ICMP 18418 / T49) TaxID=1303518 RepID=S0EVS5_CHTCT|nr:Peroxiredoxin [Chthonomonas calidirosea T49]CEK18960.1 Peroxiredoxin [Chthonomonas calidirosea]CEK18974.1 Peroxiredoxin [Chthonomonas calidirosea]CEK19964.1 Peroxiredoxin [Chthonomonas calidirosea]